MILRLEICISLCISVVPGYMYPGTDTSTVCTRTVCTRRMPALLTKKTALPVLLIERYRGGADANGATHTQKERGPVLV